MQPSGLPQSAGSSTPRLLDRWWAALLVALWIIGIVAIYYRLQLARLVQVLTR